MELIAKFTDQSASFTNGVEFGRILEKIERGDIIIMNNGFPVKIDNIEVLRQICQQYGYIPMFGRKYYNEWIEFVGIKEEAKQ